MHLIIRDFIIYNIILSDIFNKVNFVKSIPSYTLIVCIIHFVSFSLPFFLFKIVYFYNFQLSKISFG